MLQNYLYMLKKIGVKNTNIKNKPNLNVSFHFNSEVKGKLDNRGCAVFTSYKSATVLIN